MSELSPVRKKARLVRAYLLGRPIWASWQVTYACNFRCGFCSYWQDEVNFSTEARAREASLNDIRHAAGKLAALGSLMINLSGGEPFLRADFPEIVAVVAERHIPLVTTNGWPVTEENARAAWEAGLWGASVSLDFYDRAAHDAHRGMSTAAERARNALRILSRTRTRPQQRVNLLCVLNGRNLGEVEHLIRYAVEQGASFMVQPYAPIKNGNPDYIPRYASSGHLLMLRRRYPSFRSNPWFLNRFDQFYAERGVAGCRAGKAFFNIDNFLNVQKCVEFRPEPIGNLRTLEPHELVRRLREQHERNHCTACWYNCRGEIEALYSPSGLMASLPKLLW
jgi:MoaA/NifB/PqqE/SkfB family radical SAM enzyme